MPKARTMYLWLADDPAFQKLYRAAKELQGHGMAEEMLEIADDVTEDPRSRSLRLAACQWLAERLAPKKYGKKLEVEHGATDSLSAFLLRCERARSPC